MAEEKRPFWAKCRACGHCWTVCHMPMEMRKAARLMGRAACPMCGDAKPRVAKQDHGQLLEDQAA